jgi:TP901 family phage tail tape measure protein
MPTERIVIFVDEKGTRRVVRGLQGVGKAGAAATSQVGGLNTALVALGGALVLRSSISLLASFSQEMSTVRAITGATAQEFASLQDIARDLGATTRFAATEAAQGLAFLARAGFSAAEAIDTIDDTLNLAQAGALDLASAADIASNVLRGFRLATNQAGRVVDVLALAANKSNTNVQQLGDALKFVAPVAAGVGVEIEETTAAISALSDAGLQASLAGTGLRRILSELESPASKTQKILRSLGVTADEVKVSQVGLTGALERLAKSGIDTGLALEVFGDRGGPAFEVLREAVRDGSITKMRDQLDNAGGTAERVASIMDDNLNGALLALRSAAQEVILAFGDMGGSMNVLEKIVRALADSLRFLAEHVEIVAAAITALLIPAVKKLFGFIIAHPVGLLIVALGAAVGALISFKDEILVTGDGMTTLGDVIAVVIENITESFRLLEEVVGTAFEFFGVQARDAAGEMNLSFKSVVRFAALAFDSVVATVAGAFTAMVVTFQEFPNIIGDVFFQAVNFAIKQIENLINAGIRLLNKFIIEAERIVNVIRLNLGKDPIVLGDLIKPANLGALENPFKKSAENLGATVKIGFDIGFQGAGTPATDLVDDIFDRAEARAKQRTEQRGREAAFEVAPQFGGGIGGALGGPLGASFGAGVETLGRVFAQTEAGQQFFDMVEKGAAAMGDFADNLSDVNSNAEEAPGFLDGMTQALAQLDASTVALGRNVGDKLVGAFDDATGALADFAATGFRNVEDLKAAFADLLQSLGRDIIQLILKTLILKAIGGGLGGTDSGSGLVGLVGGLLGGGGEGKAAGGGVIRNRPVRVGERGEEVFVPPSSGTIIPNNRLGGQPVVNTTVVNVDNEDSIPRAMNNPAGDNVILNSIERNPEAVRGVLGL